MKFLEDPMQTMGAGFALALVLIVLYLGMTGIGAGEVDWTGIVIRWIHFLAGITWIGLLYYFNFVQVDALKKAAADTPPTGAGITRLADLCRHYGPVSLKRLQRNMSTIRLHLPDPDDLPGPDADLEDYDTPEQRRLRRS